MAHIYTAQSIISWGKHKGKKLQDLPAGYLLWLYDNIKYLDVGLKRYIKLHFSSLKDLARQDNMESQAYRDYKEMNDDNLWK